MQYIWSFLDFLGEISLTRCTYIEAGLPSLPLESVDQKKATLKYDLAHSKVNV